MTNATPEVIRKVASFAATKAQDAVGAERLATAARTPDFLFYP